MRVWLRRWPISALLTSSFALCILPTRAQQIIQPNAQQQLGSMETPTAAQKVHVSGNLTLQGSTLGLGNGSNITAGPQTLTIHLTRGGELRVCATTQVHLSQANSQADKSGPDQNSPLMLALDRGALETKYTLGKDSDVILTPDLRILLSGPGQSNVRIRVNAQGDTCVDNPAAPAEANAPYVANVPYVTVSEQMGDGVYRVQPNQRVLFEHGSLRDVVDNEPEPCGCPVAPVVSVASAGLSSTEKIAQPGQAVADAATAFPLAESEGLAPPPGPPTQPVVAIGQRHVEVATTLDYSGKDNRVTSPATDDATSSPASTPASAPAAASSAAATLNTSSANTSSANTSAIAQAPPPQKKSAGSLLQHIGHFFKRIFKKV